MLVNITNLYVYYNEPPGLPRVLPVGPLRALPAGCHVLRAPLHLEDIRGQEIYMLYVQEVVTRPKVLNRTILSN